MSTWAPVLGLPTILPQTANSGFAPVAMSVAGKVVAMPDPLPQTANSGFLPVAGPTIVAIKFGGSGATQTYGYPI